MWHLGTPALEVAIRCALVYSTVLVGLRLSGKREVGQMTPFDLVLILLISNAVQNAMVGPDTSVWGGLIAAATLFLLNRVVAAFARGSETAARLVEGTPTLLIRRGTVIDANLARERITRDDLFRALREHGIDDVATVRSAILEVDGSISVMKEEEFPTEHRPHHRIRGIRRKS